jgi:hypothetical protein
MQIKMSEGIFKYIPGFTFRFTELCIALVLLSFPWMNTLYSQDFYSTRKGQVIVQSVYYDTVLAVKSNELVMNLDYGKANLKMSVNLSSFDSGIDSVNEKFKELTNKNISFTGKLDLDYINTKPHLPQSFSFGGTVTYSGINEEVKGKGT